MILRKPYAFLIKHFRLIHLIMTGLVLFVILKAKNMFDFFLNYIANNGNIEVISSKYISYYIFAFLFLLILLSGVILYLMKYKKKPTLFYIITIAVSMVSFALFIYLYTCIRGLETSSVSGSTIRFFRDLSRINFIILIIIEIPMVVRGLGFDLKKFNFSSDAKELNLTEEDRAEVEVSTSLDAETVKRVGRKTFRELKYYYKENTLIINIILVVIVIIMILVYPFNTYVVNADLSEGTLFGTNNFNMKVTSSYLSEKKRVSVNNSYVIVKISVMAKTNKYRLNLDEFVLEGKNQNYIPSQKYYNYFKDIGIGYRNYIISTEEYEDYILVYNIDNIDKDGTFKLNYLGKENKIKLNLIKD